MIAPVLGVVDADIGPSPNLTWVALSWQARPGIFQQQLKRREEFLKAALAKEEATLVEVEKEVGHRFHEVIWMISLMIEQFRTELKWLKKVSSELSQRAPAANPAPVDNDAP